MAITDYLDPASFDPDTPISDDFYRHVNGSWLDANPVPPEYPAWGSMLEVHVRNEETLHELLEAAAHEPGEPGSVTQMVGDYFASGIDAAAIEAAGLTPLRDVLDSIEAVGSIAELKTQILELQRVGVGVFHGVSVSPDFEDSSAYLAYLGQGGLGLPDRDYYLRDDDRSKALLAAYGDHVAAQFENLGLDDAPAAVAAAGVVALERRLADVSYTAEQMRDLKLILNRHEVGSLDELMPNFGLTDYVVQLGVTGDTVNVDNPGFLAELDTTLAETSIDVVRDYLRWHLIRRYAPALTSDFEGAAFAFYGRTLGGQKEMRARWTRVLAAAAGDMGDQVARLYVDEAFSPEAKRRCEEMVDHLLEAMGRSIRSLDWMTEATKEAALAKLAGFSYKIGYPDEWREYVGLEISRDSYARNRMRCARFEFDRQFGRIDEPVDTSEWELPAHVVNAYYNPLLNEVVFPAGILQPPFFYEDADDAVVYGAIGAVIGHEITHGFDDRGSQFDEHGTLRNWWTEEDRAAFEERAEILVGQFSSFTVAEDQNVNGRLTLSENIADLGGLAIAYDAFVSTLDGTEPQIGGFTPEQRFFLSYGTIWRMNYTDEYLRMVVNIDSHSPSEFRVNGPLANFRAFGEAFLVEDASPMRRTPSDVIEIW